MIGFARTSSQPSRRLTMRSLRSAVVLLGLLAGAAIPLTSEAQVFTVTPDSIIEKATPVITWDFRMVPNVKSCTATGGWSGAKALNGTETLSQINRTVLYGMVCTTLDGKMIVSWVPPTQYTNGDPLPASDIDKYKVYVAASAATLGSVAGIDVDAPTTTKTIEGLTAGTHFVAVTAVSIEAVESDLSTPGSKNITAVNVTREGTVTVKRKPNPPTATTADQG